MRNLIWLIPLIAMAVLLRILGDLRFSWAVVWGRWMVIAGNALIATAVFGQGIVRLAKWLRGPFRDRREEYIHEGAD